MGFFDDFDYEGLNIEYGIPEGKQRPLTIVEAKIETSDKNGHSEWCEISWKDDQTGEIETLNAFFIPNDSGTPEQKAKTLKRIKRLLTALKVPADKARNFGKDMIGGSNCIFTGREVLADITRRPDPKNPEYKRTFITNINPRDIVSASSADGEFKW